MNESHLARSRQQRIIRYLVFGVVIVGNALVLLSIFGVTYPSPPRYRGVFFALLYGVGMFLVGFNFGYLLGKVPPDATSGKQ